jgi:uncharacterized protein (TIGR00255 family)
MTGFGASTHESAGLRVEVEVRSVNHRHLKLSPRVPDGCLRLVPKLEELVRARVSRGTVYLTVRQGRAGKESALEVDGQLVRRLYRDLSAIAAEVGAEPPSLGQIAAIPGVVAQVEAAAGAQELEALVLKTAAEAIDQLEEMRCAEGKGIAADLTEIGAEMLELATTIEARAPAAVAEQAERLSARVAALIADAPQDRLDSGDLAREIALLSDKSDISEELQRLRSHITQVHETLDEATGPIGRKLEFLAQELLREANTMASKSHDTELVGSILSLKLCIERIREQVANLE